MRDSDVVVLWSTSRCKSELIIFGKNKGRHHTMGSLISINQLNNKSMGYNVTKVVLYFGKYTQQRDNSAEWWGQLSFEAKQSLNVPKGFEGVGFILRPGKGCTYSQWLDDASTDRMLRFCRMPNTPAKRLADKCKDDRLAFEVPIELLHNEPQTAEHIGLKALKLFVITVEDDRYGFTTEEHFFGRDYEKIDTDGAVVKNKDGKPIVHNSTRFCYWKSMNDFGREAQLAAELRHWRVVESTAEVLQRLADEFTSEK